MTPVNSQEKVHVSFKNVNKTYDGENLVVDNLNFDILQGEFTTLLGPSGSGKTTCLMMLAGFETVTNGEIYLDDKPISKVPPHKRNLGLVFQNYALFPHMTIAQNLAFPLEVRKYSKEKIEQQIEKALAMVRLEGFGGRKISQLSGGQKQRIAVARALVFEPDLILMDEPLGALDKNLREEMQYEIKHLHDSLNKTFIYVTHDQTEAITMSDRVAVFNAGKIRQYSNPTELYEYPNNYFVANFIGENNAFEGKVKIIDKEQCTIELTNLDKTLIKANAIDINEVGQKTLVSVRPEKLMVNGEDTDKDLNTIEATVEEIIYLGDHIRIRFRVADNDEIITKIPNSGKSASIAVGEHAKLSWHWQYGRAFTL